MSDISEGLRVTLTSLAVFGALFLTAMTMQWLAYDERQAALIGAKRNGRPQACMRHGRMGCITLTWIVVQERAAGKRWLFSFDRIVVARNIPGGGNIAGSIRGFEWTDDRDSAHVFHDDDKQAALTAARLLSGSVEALD